MRWEDERYVRLYTRDTATWKLLPWESKCLLPIIMRKLDRAGIVDLGDDGVAGLAALLDMPAEFVHQGLPELLKRRVFVMSGSSLVMPNFLPAQETRQSDAQRKRDSRERERAEALGVSPSVQLGHHLSPTSPTESPPVTPCLPVPSLADPPKPPDGCGDGSSIPVGENSARFRLEKSIVRLEQENWVAAYARAVVRAAKKPRYGFPRHKIGALVTAIETHCLDDDRKDIDGWLDREVEAFVKAASMVDRPSPQWLRYQPDAFLDWHNDLCPGRPKPALARAGPTRPSPPSEPRMSDEEYRANAAKMAAMLAGGPLGQTG